MSRRSIRSVRTSLPTSPPSSIDANRSSAVAMTTSAMGIDLPPPVPGTMGFADQEPETVPMEVTDRALGEVAIDGEDKEDVDLDDESTQSVACKEKQRRKAHKDSKALQPPTLPLVTRKC
jgi:hypothetical protein